MIDPLHSLYVLAEYPLLAVIALAHTEAKRLDGRAIASIYKAHLASIDERTLHFREKVLIHELGIELQIKRADALLRSAR